MPTMIPWLDSRSLCFKSLLTLMLSELGWGGS